MVYGRGFVGFIVLILFKVESFMMSGIIFLCFKNKKYIFE